MKKLFSLILVLGFLFGGVASAEIAKWPSYLTKEIPVQILNKQGTPEQFLKDINQIQKQNKIDINNPKVQYQLIKVMVQTLNASVMIGKLDVTDQEKELLEKLLKKYVQ